MTKRLALFVFLSLFYLLAHAQWTKKDSISLQRLLKSDGEIKLNMDAVKQIHFDRILGTPMLVNEQPGLKLDESLPSALPGKKKIVLTLMPYTANTKYNYDPIYQRKIEVKVDTYKSNPFELLYSLTIPTNWAKKPLDGGYRKSLEEIEATGLRYNPLAERANNVAVGAWVSASGPSGHDFMKPFTKDFWNVRGRKNRARTLDVLSHYGDSTTVLLHDPLPVNIAR
ncbi:DUF4858 domain-containing protein [uncultured Bacteroides sp.]|uniref:DUF4858 domain-containing protein n=1 Tax=uncultured Bacteroides sp. TaxID=162156 RepID=UPI002AA6A578|nr:DUF4858 domain-containing protein [uncultured Bacteroides sp.]